MPLNKMVFLLLQFIPNRTSITFFVKYFDIIEKFLFCKFINYAEICDSLYYIFVDLIFRQNTMGFSRLSIKIYLIFSKGDIIWYLTKR